MSKRVRRCEVTYILQGKNDKEQTTRIATCEDDNSVDIVAQVMLDNFHEVHYVGIYRTDKPYIERGRVLRGDETLLIRAIWPYGG